MDAKELRVGNFVTAIRCDNSQIIDQVKQLHESYVVTKFDWGKVEPIPLTEEWLTKLGFEQMSSYCGCDGYHWVINYEVDNEKNDFTMFMGVEYEKDKSNKFFIEPFEIMSSGKLFIKHVHQLQNLYFALTGEELEIK